MGEIAYQHFDPLLTPPRQQVLDTLAADLRRRDRVGRTLPDDRLLALTIIDEYIQYPPPAAGDAPD
jgi:hypothetical protein